MRWEHPDYPQRSPAEFLPVAEETGLIVPLGEWVLEESCRVLAELRATSDAVRDLRLSVNVSRRQLLDPKFPDAVRRIFESTGVPASRVDLEITESALIGDVESALVRLSALKSIGVGLHLDDFGTGYSSLSCLQRFPLDVVKIDRSFVETLGSSNSTQAVVEAVIMIAHRLGLRVTSEGVESGPQLSALCEIGSDFAQGYFIGRPVVPGELMHLLADVRPNVADRAPVPAR